MQSSGVAPNHNPDAQTPHEVYNINDSKYSKLSQVFECATFPVI